MIIILISIIYIAYFILILFLKKGWSKIPFFENKNNFKENLPNASVVVAAKNEEKNIANLLWSLVNQSDNNFELIIIDDHSQDNTFSEIEKFKNLFENIIILKAKKNGKKHAVNQAIAIASGDLILTVDADCTANQMWVETVRNFQSKNDCDLLILPVQMRENNSYLSDILQLEFVSLIVSGAGAAGGNSPIMCNAANMAFKKETYFHSQCDLHFSQQSGDDIFLLESVKRAGGKISFVKSQNAVVQTNAYKNLQDFFHQRRRWASKAIAYSDKLLIFTALTVFLISFFQIIIFIFGLFIPKYIAVFLLFFLLKYLIDIFFINKVKDFFKIKNIACNAFLLSLIYPVYICSTAIYGIIFKNQKWK